MNRRIQFVQPGCEAARECVCGLCKEPGMCDFGDCTRPAVGLCRVLRYPVCERHRNFNVSLRAGCWAKHYNGTGGDALPDCPRCGSTTPAKGSP